ncbi:short chain dehydrogenase [Streptomyces mirabilis]|uniref:Short chain dehydrogenase n=1 Tax=Streptomyces mirabilis TaxID=68239 RepID=A0A1I2LG07_9ACTN|nr:short chain dehydrogenase [Streptomyces mirabilis]
MLPRLADVPPPTDHEVLSKLTCMRCPLSFGRRAAGGTAGYVVCDLADATSVRAAVDSAVNRYGRLEIAAIRATAGTRAVVDNSSVGSLMGNPELPAHGAMKRAVNSLTESAAVTYGPEGIRVNAIAPGATATEMIRTWEKGSPGLRERLTAHTPLRRTADPQGDRPGRSLAPQ